MSACGLKLRLFRGRAITLRLLLLLTVALAVLSGATGKAYAADSTVVASGTYYGIPLYSSGSEYYDGYGPTYDWKLYDDGLLYISYSGEHYKKFNEPGWMNNREEIVRIRVINQLSYDTAPYSDETASGGYSLAATKEMFSNLPNLTEFDGQNIKIIGVEAFSGCTNLESVRIGYNRKANRYIGRNAFSGCSSLYEVEIGTSTTKSIGVYSSAFQDCPNLSSLNLSAQSLSIGDAAFAGCSSLRYTDLSTTASIGNSAFEGCSCLRALTLPSSTGAGTFLGTSAFKDCPSLESIELPSGMTTLSNNAFENDEMLEVVSLPSTLKSIGSSAFAGCTSLYSCDLPDGLQTVGGNAFQNCTSLTQANLTGATSIGAHAFEGSGLEQVTVPGGITTLTSNAFDNCDALTDVTISEGVVTLAGNTFSNCDSMQKVTVPSTVINVSSNAFASCPSLDEVWFNGDPPTFASNAFADSSATVFYPLNNKYWKSSYLQDYGGELTWTPYGDLSTSTLTVDDAVYASVAQEAPVHVVTPSKFEVSPLLYTVSYYRDEACNEPIDATEIVNVGTYYVTISGKGDMNCSGTLGPVPFQITKAPLTVSYVSETIDEGATPAYEIAYEGFVNGEDESVLATPAEVASPTTLLPGHSYDLTPEGATSGNYEITFAKGTLAVRARPIERPECADGLVYTGKSQTGVRSGTGYTLSGTTSAVKAGTYTATVKLADGYAWQDGSTETLTYTWSIDKAQLSAVFVDERIDSGEMPQLKVRVMGFVNGETAGTAAGYEVPTATVSSSLKPGYSYTARVSGGMADNYAFTYTNGKVTVNPIIIQEPDVTRSFTYDGKAHAALSEGEGYELSGVCSAIDAGSYEATATLADGYAWPDESRDVKEYAWRINPQGGTLVLEQASVSLKIAEATQVPFQYTGDGTLSARSSDESVATVSLVAGKVKVEAVGEGTARIVVSSSACANYTTPASVTLSVSVDAIDLSHCTITATGGTYTGKTFDAQVKVVTPGGAELEGVSSHALHYYDSASCVNEIAASSVKSVGTYWVRAEAMDGGRSSGHTDAVSFEIQKAILTATYAGETVAYAATPQLKVAVTGFVNRETASTADSYVAPTVTAPQVLGRATSYELEPSGGSARNYRFAYVKGTLQVRPQVVEEPIKHEGLVYTGSKQQGVTVGEHCIVSGATEGTNAQSYSVKVTPEEGCVWPGGTREQKSISWQIAKADIANATCENVADQTYTGSAVKPQPVFVMGNYALVSSRDYTLEYEDNTSAGTASIVVSGKGNLTGSKTVTFKIKPLVLDADDVSGLSSAYDYTGSSITPNPVVTCGDSTLECDKDYTVVYANNVAAGTATLTVTGKGNYRGSVTKSFEIQAVSLHNAIVEGIVDATYTGDAVTQDAVLTLNGRQLTSGTDYDVSYQNNTNAGIATVTFTGIGDVKDTIIKKFEVAPQSIALAAIEGIDPTYVYTGKEVRPVVKVVMGSAELRRGTDYVISYDDNVAVGTASVSVAGKGNYAGETLATFAITKASYDLSGVSLEGQTVAYDGKSHELTVRGQLPAGVTVSYEGNGVVEAGEHLVTATFVGDDNHEPIGSMSAMLVIRKASVPLPKPIEGLTYSGKDQTGVKGDSTYIVDGNEGKDAGMYMASIRLGDSDNYEWEDGTTEEKSIPWTIGKAVLRASYAGEGVTYGNDPQLSVDVTGFVNGETASTAKDYVAPVIDTDAKDAGAYRLVPSGGASANYEFDYVSGSLTIHPAPIVVAANPQTKVYGQSDPELTYEVYGADRESVGEITVERAEGENAGSYRIVVGVSNNRNYLPFLIGSSLTITKAEHSLEGVVFDSKTVTYDGELHVLEVGGSLPAGVTVWYEGGGHRDVGEYRIRAHFNVDENHQPIEDAWATLRIVPKDISELKITTPDSYEYTGVAVTPDVVVKHGSTVLRNGIDYTLQYQDSSGRKVSANGLKAAGNYTVIVSMKGNYAGKRSIAFTIAKAANTMTVVRGRASIRIKAGKINKKKITVASNVKFVAKPQGTVTYANVSKGKAKKLVVNAKTGKVTIPKKLKKGLYKVKVRVTASGNENYEKSTAVITYKVVIK